MALIKTGPGITDIRGGTGGIYFSRDKFGLHVSAKPRTIRRRTTLQDQQRKYFVTARTYSHINRTVGYNIYRAHLGLPMAEPPADYNEPKLKG